MVTRLIFLFLLLQSFLFSGEFTANVSRNQINLGESVTLNLTLKNASAKGNPFFDPLKKSFFIHSQQQTFNTVMINGQVTSSTTWKLTLLPQKEGEVQIPPISIDTSNGTLSSEPVMIRVVKGTAIDSTNPIDTYGMTLTSEVTNAKPYKNETFIYTVRLTSKSDLANIKMQKINIEDAIVETNGEPKIDERIVDGIRVGVIEYSYLVTPLKAGPLKLPPTTIQGMMPIARKNHFGSLFDDDFDHFSILQGFNQFKPFALTTEEVVLDIQPPIPGLIPWLPARSLRIEEIWNESQSLQSGEPFTRVFNISAEGIKSNQLPSLNDLQVDNQLFKIYADKPELGDEVKEGNLKSYRKEQYTIIPQQSGILTLPEISVVWWDVTKKETVLSRIPSRTLQVLPALENRQKSQMASAMEDASTASEPQIGVIQRNPILFALIAGLVILLFGAIFWGIALQKKITRLTEPVMQSKSNQPDKPEKRPQDKVSKKKKSSINDKNIKLQDLNPT
jgi:hypothetical protein